jgi:hypothetical protein
MAMGKPDAGGQCGVLGCTAPACGFFTSGEHLERRKVRVCDRHREVLSNGAAHRVDLGVRPAVIELEPQDA